MFYVLSPDQMRSADVTAIKDFGIPGILLMENAARSAAEYIEDYFEGDTGLDILILCGSGNNGGDGFAVARHLHETQNVRVLWIGKEEKMSPETSVNFHAVKKLGIPVRQLVSGEDLEQENFDAECIVDSMIGVGGSENLKGLVVPIVQKANDSDALRVAIDAPTGLNTSTGIAHSDCFLADHTVTMFAIKSGMLVNDGIDVCGIIDVAYLGAPEHIVRKYSDISILEHDDYIYSSAYRETVSSKFDYGRAVIIAGSKKYPGAAALSANSAITSGPGFVYLLTTQLHNSLLPEIIPEILPSTDSGSISNKAKDAILEVAEKADAIAVGPGLSADEESLGLVSDLIGLFPPDKPLVIDGDGLRAINIDSKLRQNIILTPHTGEFSRITGIPREEVELNALPLAKEWAEKLGCIILLKHVPVVISDGKETYLNVNGNPGMATAGSGDVLTGLIAGLLAQGLPPLEAASLGAYIHADAGDWYASEFSEETLTASELIRAMKVVMSENED